MESNNIIQKLPKNIIINITDFLNPKEFIKFCLASKYIYNDFYQDKEGIVWKNIAIKYFLIHKNIRLPPKYHKELIKENPDKSIYKELVKYSTDKYKEYKQILDLTLKDKLKINIKQYQENEYKHFERIKYIAEDFYGKKNLLEKMGKPDQSFNIPLNLFVYLTIYDLNKIQIDYEDTGFLGGMSFYDFHTQTYAKAQVFEQHNLILHQIGQVQEGFGIYMDIDNFLQEENNETLYIKLEYDANISFLHIYNNDFDEYMNMIKNLELNESEKYLDLMDTQHNPCSDKTTHGIRVRVCCKYMPGFGESFQKFFYIYQIRISDDGIEQGKKYRLQSRYWKIKQNGQEEIVQGEGVIGKFPILYNDCEDFIYASCCQLQGYTGSMEGYFIFQNINDLDDQIKVDIAEFQLALKPSEKVYYMDFCKNEKIQIYPPLVQMEIE